MVLATGLGCALNSLCVMGKWLGVGALLVMLWGTGYALWFGDTVKIC